MIGMTESNRPGPELADLVRRRLADLHLSNRTAAAKARQLGHKVSFSTFSAIANQAERHRSPFHGTLRGIAAVLEVPYSVVGEAAARASGYIGPEDEVIHGGSRGSQ